MTLYATALWFYAVMASVVFGASVYEVLVVHPAWSRKPPESLAGFRGAPISRMNLGRFWAPTASLYALSGLVAFAVGLRAGNLRAPLALSSACAVAAVAWTLAYFRPTITRLLERGGGGIPAERLESEVRRWILLNWIRSAMVAVSWWGALIALTSSR